MILYNVAQARSNTLAHNDKLRKIMDVIIGAVVKSVEEGKFETGELPFSTGELAGNEAFIKGYFESLGYKCYYEKDCRNRGTVLFEINWY